ncbi:MAG: NAD(P)H-quinone oxidoreductase [Myxococcales bacterium]|nr:NAD(P)H-quinone oxidoreductase [Myxococcales bacterium]
MRVVKIEGRGGPEVLQLREAPEPVPGPEEVLVKVHASAVNRADLLQCMGLYPAPRGVPADIPGLEYAGEVLAAGSRVTRHRPGDKVMGVAGGGAFAEQLVAHEREAVAPPPGASAAEAAAIPEAFFTALDALLMQADLRPGEAVLVHAAGSGVGTAAVQIASAIGATAIGTSRTEAKLARLGALGMAHGIAIAGKEPRFAERVRELTSGRGADVVLDLLGGRLLEETLAATAERGRMMLVGLLAGVHAEVSLGTLLTRRIRLTGTVLRSRPLEEKIAVAQAFERQLLPLFGRGKLRPVIDSALPFEKVREAVQRLSSNETFGKVVLAWSQP